MFKRVWLQNTRNKKAADKNQAAFALLCLFDAI